MAIRLVKHIRWCPPDYHLIERSAPPRLVSTEWIVIDFPDPPSYLLWLPWSMLLRCGYGYGEPGYEPDFPWHADVVAISEDADGTLVVKDMLVDVMVSEDGSRYKVVDLDQLVECQTAGKITVAETFEALVTLQRWLQMLHGWQVEKDFPPKSLPQVE
jgi:hypothetical protein